MNLLGGVRPTKAERSAPLPGDDLVAHASVVMDRGFDLPAPPDAVWPWFVQLGKQRAGWYLPRVIEHVVPASRRGLRSLDDRFLDLAVGDEIPDWGGRHETFTVAILDPPRALVHRSVRGHVALSWAIVLSANSAGTRVHLRLRLGGVKHGRIASTAGDIFDLVTVLELARGLRERLAPEPAAPFVQLTALVTEAFPAYPPYGGQFDEAGTCRRQSRRGGAASDQCYCGGGVADGRARRPLLGAPHDVPVR